MLDQYSMQDYWLKDTSNGFDSSFDQKDVSTIDRENVECHASVFLWANQTKQMELIGIEPQGT